MEVRYEEKYDILRILLSEARIVDSDEAAPGFVLDFDEQGKVVGLEIIDASKTVTNPRSFAFAAGSGIAAGK